MAQTLAADRIYSEWIAYPLLLFQSRRAIHPHRVSGYLELSDILCRACPSCSPNFHMGFSARGRIGEREREKREEEEEEEEDTMERGGGGGSICWPVKKSPLSKQQKPPFGFSSAYGFEFPLLIMHLTAASTIQPHRHTNIPSSPAPPCTSTSSFVPVPFACQVLCLFLQASR